MTDFIRNRNMEEDKAEDRYLWRLGEDGRTALGFIDPNNIYIYIYVCLCVCVCVCVTESRLKPNGFRMAVAQRLTKFDAVALLQSLRHFPYSGNPTGALNSTSLKCYLRSTDTIDKLEKCTHTYEDSRSTHSIALH